MALLLAGALLLLLLEQTGLENWCLSSPWPTFYRMGQALLALGFLSALPVGPVPGLVTLGRSSLGVRRPGSSCSTAGPATTGWSARGHGSSRCPWPSG